MMMFLKLSVNVPANLGELSNSTSYCHNFTYASHIFLLNNMFLHETNTFYFVVLLTFLLKIVNV